MSPWAPSLHDADEMKSRQYERGQIIQAQKCQKVCDLIEKAFHSVVLDDGIGLIESQAIDMMEDEKTQLGYREQDERLNWRLIPAQDLRNYCTSLSFTDQKGRRFLLPAYLIWDLNWTFEDETGSILFCLTYPKIIHRDFDSKGYFESKFALLSKSQRLAVGEYLKYVAVERVDDYDDLIDIEKALDEYWFK